jgi:hypothetical protein
MEGTIQDLVPQEDCSVCGVRLPHQLEEADRIFLGKLEEAYTELQFRAADGDQRAKDLLFGVGQMMGQLQHGDPPTSEEVKGLMQSLRQP